MNSMIINFNIYTLKNKMIKINIKHFIVELRYNEELNKNSLNSNNINEKFSLSKNLWEKNYFLLIYF